jgi:predicted double-glycine peptidase
MKFILYSVIKSTNLTLFDPNLSSIKGEIFCFGINVQWIGIKMKGRISDEWQ